MLETSAAGGGEAAKPWAFEAGTRAVQAHCERIGAAGPGRARPEPTPASTTSSRGSREQPLVSIVIPTAGQRREVRYEEVVLVEPLRPQHRRDARPTRTTRSSASPTPSTAGRRCSRSCSDDRRRAPAAGRRTTGRSTSRPRSTSAPRAARASTCCCSTTTSRSSTPDWIERMVMYSQHPGDRRRRRPAALGGRPPPARRRPLRERRPARATSTAASPATIAATRNDVRVAQQLPRGHRRLPDDAARDAVRARSAASATELPVNYNDVDYCLEAARRAGSGSSTTRTWSSTTSSPRAARSEVEDWEKDLLRRALAAADRRRPLFQPEPAGRDSQPDLRLPVG